MNERDKLKALMEIYGDTEKYQKGLEALTPTPIDQVKAAASGRLPSLIVGVILVSIGIYFNPQIPAQIWAFVDQLQLTDSGSIRNGEER